MNRNRKKNKAAMQPAQNGAVVQPTREMIAKKKRIDELNELLVNSKTELPEVQAIISVNGIPAFSVGDVVAIKAKPKNGKTSALKYLTASMMIGELPPIKCEIEECRVLWFDTEENLHDVKKIIEDIHQISSMEYEYIDSHLRVYTVRKLSFRTLLEDTITLIKAYHPDVVVIDGIVDYIESFNDETLSHNLINELVRVSEENKCAVCCVLHENKTSDDHNMRGHLGTMLQQKASTVFQCVMKDGVITVGCTDARHRATPDWHIMYDENGHIVSADNTDGCVDSPALRKSQQRLDVIKNIIQERGGKILRKELTANLMDAFKLDRTTISNMITGLINNQTLSINMGAISWQQDLFDQEVGQEAH